MKSTENTKNTPSRLGFTLVELIVVITILVILATIAFTQFGSFQGSARDGDRVTTLKNIEKGLDVFQIKSGIYPLPEGEVSQGTINGSTEVYAYKGEIGDYVSRLISINKTPADPLSASHYVYALSGDKKTYQVATVMENTQAYNTLFSPITPAFAAQTSYQARVNGTYPGYIKFSSGAQTWIANIPSLVWSNSGETVDLLSTGTYFVVNKYTNLPYKITPDAITENQPADILLQTITGQSNATLLQIEITSVKTPEQIAATFTGTTLESFSSIPGMSSSPSSPTSHIIAMERIITGNATTGGSYIPTYLNCSETTHSGYTITPLAHATSLAFTKSITNGTGSLTANCTDGQLAYDPESVQCNATFVEWPNLTCIADVCGSTITDTNAHSTATSQTPAQSWHYDATPNICTYACNPNYTHNSGTNLCEPNNCTAGVQIHNTHTYSVPQLNHSVTGSIISDPVNITNGTQTFTTTYECSFWTATGITTEVANTPNCNATYHYDTGTSSCISDTKTHTCTAKPATGTAWNSVSSYSQTWNGASYIPADSTTAYNASSDTASCRYKCDTGYVWNAGTSLCEVKLYVDDVFSAYTYTGNNATQNIVNGIDLASKGGMVWLKNRDAVSNNSLFSTTTGVNNRLFVNATTAAQQWGPTEGVKSFLSSGYTVGGTATDFNLSSNKYVSWTFRNAPKFYHHTTVIKSAGSNATVDLSTLGTVGMVRVKRTDTAGSWYIWHRSLTTGKLLIGEATDGEATLGYITVSGTTVTLVNGVIADGTYLVEGFAHDTSADGLIQCGAVTLDAYPTNTYVELGWEPQFLFNKLYNSIGGFNIHDTSRGWVNALAHNILTANTASVENAGFGTYWGGYPTATGFYLSSAIDNSGPNIYCAIRRPNKPPTSGTQVYNAIARPGTGAPATVTGVGFAPDLVNIIDRVKLSAAGSALFDRLRGGSANIRANVTSAEVSDAAVTSFNMDGMTVPNNSTSNGSNGQFINHFFRRAPWFFDVVAYTGNWTARTINHNLAAVPELMIVKNRSIANNWYVYSSFISATSYLMLDHTAATGVWGDAWNNTSPTSTLFTVGIAGSTNGSTNGLVAYLFATLPNISKVGSYTGSTSNITVDCGFTATPPRFLMVKRTDSTGDWFVWDSARGFTNRLSLNTTAAEVTGDTSITTTTSGFIANTSGVVNGGTSARYIYLCIH